MNTDKSVMFMSDLVKHRIRMEFSNHHLHNNFQGYILAPCFNKHTSYFRLQAQKEQVSELPVKHVTQLSGRTTKLTLVCLV